MDSRYKEHWCSGVPLIWQSGFTGPGEFVITRVNCIQVMGVNGVIEEDLCARFLELVLGD